MNVTLIKYILLLFFISLASEGMMQPYSIDRIQGRKKGIHISFRGLFKKDPEKKAKKKQHREMDKSFKMQRKNMRLYWRKVDKPGEMFANRTVYRRMKQDLRKSKRINHNKNATPFIRKVFTKNTKRKTHHAPLIIKWPWKKKTESS